jgi:uncharacterized phage protein gp47/JayE
MPYVVPPFDDIRQRQLRDAANLDATAHTDADSDLYVRSTCVASAAEGLYNYQLWQARQIIPDTADPEYLEQHSALRGITRKKATKATGEISFTGNAGAVVPINTQFKDANETSYVTTQTVTLDAVNESSAEAIAPCAAVRAGAMPDVVNVPVTLLSAPLGVQARATLTLAGGTDAETDASLLRRLLEYMQNPSGGGNATDYRRWALEVPGVAGAIVYPLRQGPGTVDIVITGDDGIPGQDVVDACQAHIDAMRPCTARESNVLAPVLLSVDMTLALRVQSATLVSLQSPIAAVLKSQFDLLLPGETLVLARCIAAVSGVEGVADVEVVAPVANVVPTALQWPRLGELVLEAM